MVAAGGEVADICYVLVVGSQVLNSCGVVGMIRFGRRSEIAAACRQAGRSTRQEKKQARRRNDGAEQKATYAAYITYDASVVVPSLVSTHTKMKQCTLRYVPSSKHMHRCILILLILRTNGIAKKRERERERER